MTTIQSLYILSKAIHLQSLLYGLYSPCYITYTTILGCYTIYLQSLPYTNTTYTQGLVPAICHYNNMVSTPLYSPCYMPYTTIHTWSHFLLYAIHHYTVPAICHTPLYSPCYMKTLQTKYSQEPETRNSMCSHMP